MQVLFIILLPLLLSSPTPVSTRRHKKIRTHSDYSYSDEVRRNITLDFHGSLKRSFALEAALTDPQHNVLCSPVSAILPLGKLVYGAEKQALREILAATGLAKRKHAKRKFKKLINDLQFLPQVTLDVASRIYVDRSVRVLSNFSRRVKSVFQSDVEKVSFDNPREAVDEINGWIARQTKFMIPTILAPGDISPSTSMILVNAIYFAGNWKLPFGRVFSTTFLSPTGPVIVPMISNIGQYNYYQSDSLKAQIVEIPYANENASFIVVLPNMKDGLLVILRSLKLAPEILNVELKKLRSMRMEVSIPKFKITSEMDLRVLYEKIGVRSIFNNKDSGLDGIVREISVYVSKAVHKAMIEVNEEGTKAAAASGINIALVAGVNLKFFAAHPFLFVVRVNEEQLFVGTFNGP